MFGQNVVKIPKVSLFEALHPLQERYIDAASYLEEVGRMGVEEQRARCPFCRRPTMIAQDNEDLGVLFFHRQHFSAFPCPLTTTAVQPPPLFARGIPNVAVESFNRAAFVSRWQIHFAVMAAQVRTLSIERFVNLIAVADALHLWSYEELKQNDVPFVLLALADAITDTTVAHQKMWLRFVFEGRIKTVRDLWAESEPPARLYRIQYRPRKNTRMPNASHIVLCVEVERSAVPEESPSASRSSADETLFERLLDRVDLEFRSGPRHPTDCRDGQTKPQ